MLDIEATEPGVANGLPSGVPAHLRDDGADSGGDSPMLPGRLRQLQMGKDPTDRSSPQGTLLLARKMQRQQEQLTGQQHQRRVFASSEATNVKESQSSPQGAALLARRMERQGERRAFRPSTLQSQGATLTQEQETADADADSDQPTEES